MTGSTKYQGIDGYFCDNVFNIVIVTVTYELPSYPIQKMGIFASKVNSFTHVYMYVHVRACMRTCVCIMLVDNQPHTATLKQLDEQCVLVAGGRRAAGHDGGV